MHIEVRCTRRNNEGVRPIDEYGMMNEYHVNNLCVDRPLSLEALSEMYSARLSVRTQLPMSSIDFLN